MDKPLWDVVKFVESALKSGFKGKIIFEVSDGHIVSRCRERSYDVQPLYPRTPEQLAAEKENAEISEQMFKDFYKHRKPGKG